MAGTVKKLQFSEGTDVGAPTDLGIATSTVVISAYANDAAYVTANGAAISGSVYLNTTTNKFRMYTNGAWRNVVPESDSADPTKLFLVDVTGNSTGVSATLDFNATANRTYTFPDVTDSLVPQTNPTLRGNVLLQNLSGDQPSIRFSEDPDNGTSYIEHKAADSMAGNYTVKWPAAQASAGQVLQNDGSGNLSWAATSAGNQTANIRASEGAGTTTLTNSDARIQVFNLSAARTVQLPTTGVVAGDVWEMVNPNAFILTIQSSGGNNIVKSYGSRVVVAANTNTPTTAAHWTVLEHDVIYLRSKTDFTPTFSGSIGSGGTYVAWVHRPEISKLRVHVGVQYGTSSSGNFGVTVPFSLNITTAEYKLGSATCAGWAQWFQSPFFGIGYPVTDSATSIRIYSTYNVTTFSASGLEVRLTPNLNNNDQVEMEADVLIDEFKEV